VSFLLYEFFLFACLFVGSFGFLFLSF